jgi:hypothetical protein
VTDGGNIIDDDDAGQQAGSEQWSRAREGVDSVVLYQRVLKLVVLSAAGCGTTADAKDDVSKSQFMQ